MEIEGNDIMENEVNDIVENEGNVAVNPPEVFRIWFDLKNMKTFMTNIKTGERIVPLGIDIA